MSSSRSLALLAAVLPLLSLLSLLASPATAAKPNIDHKLDLKAEAVTPIRAFSLYAPYVESNLQNKYWDFGGNAIVDTNRHVRLTQDRPSESGWLWSRLPITHDNFEIEFEFHVDGSASGHHPYGDGFALWLTKERATAGPVFGSKDYFDGVGIFFDTFSNGHHAYTFPRISLMSGKGTDSYNVGNDGASQAVAGCSIDFRASTVATKARLTVIKDVIFQLEVHYSDWDEWETCFKVDPRTLNVASPRFLGLTAATGDVHDNHDIVSVSTSQIVYKPRTAAEIAAHRAEALAVGPKAKDAKKSKGWFGLGGSKKPSSSSQVAGIPSYAESKKISYESLRHDPSARSGGKGFFGSLFGAIWTLIKWVALVGLVGSAIYAGLKYRNMQNAKRF